MANRGLCIGFKFMLLMIDTTLISLPANLVQYFLELVRGQSDQKR